MRNPWNSLVNQATVTAFMIIVVVLGALVGSSRAQELAGELVAASGPVEVRPLGEPTWRAASLRAVLHPGDMVRTGPGGAAEVALVQGVFRMDENTVIILPPPQAVPAAAGQPTGVRLLLYRGRALFQLLKERLQGSFDVITPSVIVGVKGTAFGVQEGRQVGVVVFEGTVAVVPTGRPDASPAALAAGQFTLLVDGQLTPPQAYSADVPGGFWSGGPTSTEGQPLSASPPLPAPAPSPGPSADVAPGAGAPALADVGGAPGLTSLGLGGMQPPLLAAVGGPPGSSGAFVTSTLGSTLSPVARDSLGVSPAALCRGGGQGLALGLSKRAQGRAVGLGRGGC